MKELNNIDKALKDFLTKTKNKAVGDSIPQMQQQITQNVINSFAPVIQQLADQAKISKDDLASVLKEIQIVAPEARIPEIRIPEFKIPTPQVTVNVPKGETPIVNVAPTPVTFPDSMRLSGIDNKNPLPMLMVGVDGKPVSFSMGASGGRGDFFTIKDIQNSTGGSVIDADGNVKVAGSFSVTASNSSTQAIDSSGEPYSQANPFPVVFSSSASTASALIDSSGVQYSGSNPVPVVITSGASATSATNIVDSSGVAYSGSNPVPVTGTVAVSGVTSSIGVSILNGEGILRNSWLVSDITASVKSALVDSTGVQYSGSNPVPITGTVAVSGITNSVASALIDSAGSQYSTTNPLPVNTVGGGPDSMFLYEARTTNPTAVSDGADVRPTTDKLGRTLNRPVQVRDLTVTAYTSVSTGTEATLLSGVAGKYHDLIYVLASNNSTVATSIDIRGVTAGNILMHLEIPANGVVGVSTPVPIPQSGADTGNNWTIDMPDITGTTVYVSALFTQEV